MLLGAALDTEGPSIDNATNPLLQESGLTLIHAGVSQF